MNRESFMRELEYLLQDIPDEDKADALAYYRDYLEEAGEENEEAVIKEFGSPERIAAIIRSDIDGVLEDGGEFTESGYRDERFKDPNYQITERFELPEVKPDPESKDGARQNYGQKSRGSKVLMVILWAVLICVAAPVLLGIGGGIIGIISSAAAFLLMLIILIGLITFILFLCAIVSGVCGVVVIFSSPATGILLIGIGVLLLGLGLLGLVVSVLFYGKFLPFLLRSAVDGLNRLVHRRKGGVR